jgi:carbamoyl-phosphate synthase small subunit
MRESTTKNAVIVFNNGTYLLGTAFGAEVQEVSGELCFNTAMTGYQEILTDPSYAKQVIVFSFPHIGNVGCNVEDDESSAESIIKPTAQAAIFREYPTNPSNFRAEESLETFMKRKGILSICNLDTRQIIQEIRLGNISRCIISRNVNDVANLLKKINEVASTKNLNLAKDGSCENAYKYCESTNGINKKVAVIDYGTKENILRIVKNAGMEVHVFPWNSTFEEIASIKPDGVLLSNGPGDPRATLPHTKATLLEILKNKIPLFGICLGHQLLALTLGCKVEKLEQGHRGTNHPVFNYESQKVEITTQNHGFAILEANIPSFVEITHRSLFDGIIEGIALKFDEKVAIDGIEFISGYAKSVQYHPESSGGPHDSLYLFEKFFEEVKSEVKL